MDAFFEDFGISSKGGLHHWSRLVNGAGRRQQGRGPRCGVGVKNKGLRAGLPRKALGQCWRTQIHGLRVYTAAQGGANRFTFQSVSRPDRTNANREPTVIDIHADDPDGWNGRFTCPTIITKEP